jgi:hypothetical protein
LEKFDGDLRDGGQAGGVVALFLEAGTVVELAFGFVRVLVSVGEVAAEGEELAGVCKLG